MAKKKHRGLWDASLLRTLMDEGKVYVECQYCGTHIESWATVVTGKCHKCGRQHGIAERITEARRAAETKEANRLAQKHKSVRNILFKGKGCVYGEKEDNVVVYKGEEGWNYFVNGILCKYRPYACLTCLSCGYVHIVRASGDINWAGDLYYVRRGDGAISDDNWEATFRCLSCGNFYKEIPISVKY